MGKKYKKKYLFCTGYPRIAKTNKNTKNCLKSTKKCHFWRILANFTAPEATPLYPEFFFRQFLNLTDLFLPKNTNKTILNQFWGHAGGRMSNGTPSPI